ncbi:uncharacterized protein [Lolium perenne]|uniref:uncharacterized protein n=1 Tax=Lolium perenne TaxID=4522 RepID=UPI0021F59E57|nr:uncharacterized protein LOC127302468 [Lolium perenne]
MCSGSWNSKIQWSSPAVFIRRRQQQKKPDVSVMTLRRKRLRLISRRRRAAGAELGLIRRRRRRAAEADMAMLNLKLHLENRRILAENERLRERAGVLRRENLALRENLCKTVAEAAPPAEATNGC